MPLNAYSEEVNGVVSRGELGWGHGASSASGEVGMGMGMKRVDQAISHLNN